MIDSLFSKQEKKVYKCIRIRKIMSANELRSMLQLSLPTILKTLKQLEDKGYIFSSEGESTGGRRPLLFAVNPNVFYAFGVLLDPGTKIKVILINSDYKIVDYKELSWLERKTPAEHLDDISTAIIDLKNKYNSNNRMKFLGVGIGSVGPIDIKKGIFLSEKRFPIKGWENIALTDIIESNTGLPTYINNLARLGLLSHKVISKDKYSANIAYILINRGIGLGIMIDNKIVSTSSTMTGALDHMVIKYDSEDIPCDICGRRGCLTSVLSKQIQQDNENINFNNYSKLPYLNNLLNLADQGEKTARDELKNIIYPIGLAIVNFLTFALVDTIIISGEIFQNSRICFDILKDIIDSQYGRHCGMSYRVVLDEMNPKSTLLGCGIQVFYNKFK